MDAPAGYTLGKPIHTSQHSQVHAAVRESDGLAVVLKSFHGEKSQSAEKRAQRELEILGRIDATGISQPLELTLAGTLPTLVLERVAGVTLSEWIGTSRPSLCELLEVAIQVADALAQVHQARTLHCDITPENVMVEPMTLRAHLIDFDRARPLGVAAETWSTSDRSGRFGDTLLYISPEATRRMGRGLDSRSDLYSLGAVLYFALTGQPPFQTSDPLALLHAHLARVPAAAIEMRPDVPPTLSRIASKLLQKMPEDRYQTAHALAFDLRECRKQLLERGAIAADLPLGTADAPHRPLFSKTLFGRSEEVRRLNEAYARAAAGAPVAVLLAGAPGIGKSELINSLRIPVADTNGYLSLGKFDQYRRDVPYAAFAQALTGLFNQILAEDEAHLASWRAELRQSLGAVAGAVIALVPDLRFILPDAPPVPPLGPAETRARLGLAFRYLIRGAATRDHPLVLCLDDLQWADAASRDLLRELLLENRDGALLLLGIYRDTEVDDKHPLSTLIANLAHQGVDLDHLELGPLSESACAQMLAAALGRTEDQCLRLAERVARRTGNTPLFIQQLVHHAHDVGLIHFAPGVGWTWDDAEIARADIPDGAVPLMIAKIGRLEPQVAQVLELASCMGDCFEAGALAELCEHPRAGLESALFELSDDGLIVPDQAGFRFAHDRIREAAQSRLPHEERIRVHETAARWLLERHDEDFVREHVFDIADHLVHAREVLGPELRPRAISIFLMAGKQALGAGASASAEPYFDHALAVFGDQTFEADPGLAFELSFSSAECAFQVAKFPLALERLAWLERQPLSDLQSALVTGKQISVHSMVTPDDPKLLPMVLAGLRRFGVRWPAFPSHLRTRLTIAWTDLLLRGPLDDRSFRPATPEVHVREMPVAMIFVAGAPVMTVNTGRLMCLLSSYGLRRFRRFGYLLPPTAVLAAYGAFRLGYLGHLRGAERYAAAALDWQRRAPNPMDPRGEYVVHAFIYAWTRARRSVIEPLRRLSDVFLELGDVEYALFATLQRVSYLALCGEPISTLEGEFAELGRQPVHRTTAPYVEAVRAIADPNISREDLKAALGAVQLARGQAPSQAMQPWGFWLGVQCICGFYEETLHTAQEIASLIAEVGMTISQVVDCAFFSGIAAAELAGRRGGSRGARRWFRAQKRRVDVWARLGPDFRHMARALEAERLRLRGGLAAALSHYAEAARQAEEAGYTHHAAFILERRAAVSSALRHSSEARLALSRARALYDEWGAHAKVAQLDRDS